MPDGGEDKNPALTAAAKEAIADLENLEEAAVKSMAAWWTKWYLKAGHKRLGRLLVDISKQGTAPGGA